MAKAIRILLRVVCGCSVLALIFFGIGMLPARIEGVYRDKGARCMCGGVACLQFRDGKVISFNSNHGAAELFGRYETNTDGSVKVFMSPTQEGESDRLFTTAIPRFWFTQFRTTAGNSAEWFWKFPVNGDIAKTIADQEISSSIVKGDRTVVKTIYNSLLKELRTETMQLQAKCKNAPTVESSLTVPSRNDSH